MKAYLIISVSVFFEIVSWAVILQVLLSWMPGMNTKGRFFYILDDMTYPILSFFKKIVPPIGMIDISPIVAIFAIDFVRWIVVSLISLL